MKNGRGKEQKTMKIKINNFNATEKDLIKFLEEITKDSEKEFLLIKKTKDGFIIKSREFID